MDEETHELLGNRSLLFPTHDVNFHINNSVQETEGGKQAYVPMDRAFIQFQHDSDTRHGHHSVHYVLDNGARVGSFHWHKTYGTSEHEGAESIFDPGKRGKPLKGRFAKESNNLIRYNLKSAASAFASRYNLTQPRN